ncbi:MAG: discoidin domain-containing protein, partial [Myxococcota bacterium]
MTRAAAAIFLVFLVSATAAADEPACPPGNLLAGKAPSQSSGVGAPSRLTNGVMANEGEAWDSTLTSKIDAGGYLVYDLGAPTRITALDLQGDNNDEYLVDISDDGQSFTQIWSGDPVRGEGMRRRNVRGLDAVGRYLRFRAQGGDNYYSLSEVQAFCQPPASWPPPVELKGTGAWWWKNLMKKRDHRYRLGLNVLGLLFFLALFAASERK